MWRQDHAEADLQDVPGDMVTASASGLDPHITLQNAEYQLDRVASKWATDTKRDPGAVRTEIEQMLQTDAFAPLGGLVGEKMINVLQVNLELNKHYGAPPAWSVHASAASAQVEDVIRGHRVMDVRRPYGAPALEFRNNNRPLAGPVEEDLMLESRNPETAAMLETVERAAAGDSTILLTGESGTGKDVLARQIHRWSPRRNGPFVVINCTTLAEHLLEDELFGHVRGSFTGAINDKPGRLEAGNGGTVLFDEIAELPTSLQIKLLRFVQDRCLERIGSDRTLRVDVRVVVASNRNLEAEVAAGRFREDLYYRLNVITFTLPPLRERTQDILPFADWMLQRMSLAIGRPGRRLSPEAAAALIGYRWPGNVRELNNALKRAADLARSETITLDDLPDSVSRRAPAMCTPTVRGTSLKDFEREQILRALAQSPTLSEAAATLGINVTTLWRKRRHYGIG